MMRNKGGGIFSQYISHDNKPSSPRACAAHVEKEMKEIDKLLYESFQLEELCFGHLHPSVG